MQMQISVYDANDFKDTNANLNVMIQMLLKMQMQMMYDANALKNENANDAKCSLYLYCENSFFTRMQL